MSQENIIRLDWIGFMVTNNHYTCQTSTSNGFWDTCIKLSKSMHFLEPITQKGLGEHMNINQRLVTFSMQFSLGNTRE